MKHRILVPLDILDDTHPALEKARLSFPDAEVFLLHVVTLPIISSPLATAGGSYAASHAVTEVESRLVPEAREALSKLGQGEVISSGEPASEILRYARSGRFDFILMGTAGRKGLERLFLGSVAEAVIRESPIPVITLRAVKDHSPQPTPVQRVLVMHDFSPAADRAMAFVADHFPEAQIDVLHAAAPGLLEGRAPLTNSGLSHALLAENRQSWLGRIKRRLGKRGGGEIVEGDPITLALERADTGRYDLLAVGTSSRGTLDRLLFGSVAQGIVRGAEVPVLTVSEVGENEA